MAAVTRRQSAHRTRPARTGRTSGCLTKSGRTSDCPNELVEPDLSATSGPHVSRDPEPLEQAQRRQEAPEASQISRSEAPEAGACCEESLPEQSSRGRSRS